jgi:ABC-2 type transport system ATP-binding protein
MPSVLTIDSLRKTYGDTVAVDDLSLTVRTGEVFGVIGPNGAGKTTTVECALGLRRPDAGTVRVLGRDPQAGGAELYRRVGAQLQAAALPARITVQEALDLFASFYPASSDRDALLGRWGLADERDTAFEALSGGQKQRLFVALALVHDPELVVLDEISTGLDPEARRATRDLIRDIREQGTTVVLVTHFMDEAEALCDRVALLDRGRCVAIAPPSALVDRLDASYRVRFARPPSFDPAPLRALDGVDAVEATDGTVAVRGDDDLLTTVVRHLSARGVTPRDLHAERVPLEDAFLALTDETTPPPDSALRNAQSARRPEKEPL